MHDDRPQFTVKCHFGRKHWRETTVIQGGEYVIVPLNPQKTRNRGRRCQVISITTEERTIQVRFLDTGRVGRVDPSDLTAPGLTRESTDGMLKPADPAGLIGLHVDTLAGAVAELCDEVQKRVAKADHNDPEDAFRLVTEQLYVKGLADVLRIVGDSIPAAAHREQFLCIQKRLQGTMGAVAGAASAARKRWDDLAKQNRH